MREASRSCKQKALVRVEIVNNFVFVGEDPIVAVGRRVVGWNRMTTCTGRDLARLIARTHTRFYFKATHDAANDLGYLPEPSS